MACGQLFGLFWGGSGVWSAVTAWVDHGVWPGFLGCCGLSMERGLFFAPLWDVHALWPVFGMAVLESPAGSRAMHDMAGGLNPDP